MIRWALEMLGLRKPAKTLDDYAAEWGAALRDLAAAQDTRRMCAGLPPATPCPVCHSEAFRRAVIREGAEP